MAYTISLANQKGGVGKTTSAVNLAAAIGSLGKRALLIDLDPQGNTTSGVGVQRKRVKVSSYDVMIGSSPASAAIIDTGFENLSLIPSQIDLAGAEFELVDLEKRELVLKEALKPIEGDFDYIFIDCPPSLELLTLNALCAADQILIPVQCEYYALEGLSDLMTTLRAVKRRLNPGLSVFGVLLTMFDGRTNFSAQVAEEVRRHFPGKVFAAAIPRNVRLAEAPSHGLPVMAYDRFSRGAAAYEQVAQEIIAKE